MKTFTQQSVVQAAVIMSFVVISLLIAVNWGHYPFELTFRPISLLYASAALVNSILIFLVNRPRIRSSQTYWFSMALFFVVVWSVAQTMQVLSATPDSFYFWFHFEFTGSVFVPVFLLLFVKKYTDGGEVHPVLGMLLFFSAMFLAFLSHVTEVFFLRDVLPELTAWGFSEALGPFFPLFLLWYIALFAAALYKLWAQYRSAEAPDRKNQARLFVVALAIPIVAGLFTDGLLLLFVETAPPLAMAFTSVMGIMITFGIYKYKLFAVDPQLLADKTIQSMNEGIILLDTGMRVQFVNDAVKEFLSGRPQNYITDHVRVLFPDINWDDGALRDEYHREALEFERTKLRVSSSQFRPVSLSVTRLYNDADLPIGYLVIVSDISQLARVNKELQKQVEESEKLNQMLIGRELKMIELKKELDRYKEQSEHESGE